MENVEKLKAQIATLEKEVLTLRGYASKSAMRWVNVVKFLGLIAMLLPLVPNALYYIGLHEAKEAIEGSDYGFVGFGATLFFAQKYVGEFLNAIGKKIIQKFT